VQAVQNSARISVEDYLAGEQDGDTRHEYIGGLVYAMAGTGSRHNAICVNLAVALRPHLRGKPCQVFILDVKVRLQVANEEMFYYPDLIVTCDARDTEDYFKKFPKVLIEVFSPATERFDRHEKLSNYTQIESLEEYVLVAQDWMEATVFRRAEKWRAEVANQPLQQLRIPSLDFTVALSDIYDSALPPDGSA
jgi:Uma2 family endonuclease